MSNTTRRPAPAEIPPFYQNYVAQVTGDNIEDILDAARKESTAFFELIPAEKHDYRYAPDKWTIKEVLQHIIDSERVFAYRILRIARGDKTPLPGFDQNVFAQHAEADRRSFYSLIAEYRSVREATLLMLRYLSPEAWERKGTASGAEFSPLTIAYITAGHEAHHLRIIAERYL